jgi:hypothetical protein
MRKFFTATFKFVTVREIRRQRLISNSSRRGKNRWAGPKIFVYIRFANLRDFSPEKANFMILFKNVLDIFKTDIWTFKVLR